MKTLNDLPDGAEECRELARNDPEFAAWAQGHGPIRHLPGTQLRVHQMVQSLRQDGVAGDGVQPYALLRALDRLTSAGMWLVAHLTYAQRVHTDGRPLQPDDFKDSPQGHMGGSLNMVPAYAGYLAANVLCGVTRAWMMGQGHCVSAIDSLNLLVGNLTPEHARRYAYDDAALSRMAQDFYRMRLDAAGMPASPLGSHVNAHTAGSLIEGGFLGFAELLYPHVPLPGERLVTFLSDGAFEEQRGSDWAPRWWRAEDSGLVAPIMIANGRRIDSRTLTEQEGGPAWLIRHLQLNGFEPFLIDGRDPAAFAWAIWHMERSLQWQAADIAAGRSGYPVRLPYAVAAAPKGAGFHGEGTNAAHNLPLPGIPSRDAESARLFNQSAAALWVPAEELRQAAACFAQHRDRPRERDHAVAHRTVEARAFPSIPYRSESADLRDPPAWQYCSAMEAVDGYFSELARLNPALRPRMGNPDESHSNHMDRTLRLLRHRVTAVERPDAESLQGGIITALNEEAVVCAALGNKGGLNIVTTYEAFAVKMVSAIRQELVFTDQARAAGKPPHWLSWPLVLTSHTWENGKNERSHQDPTAAEALLAEPADVSRVVFAADYNHALAVMNELYHTQGSIWTLVCPKQEVPLLLSDKEALWLARFGALRLQRAGLHRAESRLVLTAVGAYQLAEVLKASSRLQQRGFAHAVVYVAEPGRLRHGRNAREQAHTVESAYVDALYGGADLHLLVTHTHPEPVWGLLAPHLHGTVVATGYNNVGGTLDTPGLLFANGCSWLHLLRLSAGLLWVPEQRVLLPEELAALDGHGDPDSALRLPCRSPD